MKSEQHESESPISIEGLSNSKSVPIAVWDANNYPNGRWVDATRERAGILFKDSAHVTSAWDIRPPNNIVGGRKAFHSLTLTKSGPGGQCLGLATDTPVDARHCYCELDLFCKPYPEITVCVLSKETNASGTYQNIGYGYMAIWLFT
ncbi:hypothetical protein [Xenorhabdus japonica]|uniref:Uncharacterized protein n=1 Tax=Xenorhabdus japonica TaxID=53341 RepID=A0A1I5DDK4_9GAMM|nr:hypothetical protein [Xenorhabdus japonica]SFN97329.1 hypothetical protein SAMN05421579_1396 [Xenorhabdus japonica]